MSNYAMVNNQTNVIDTVIVWDGITPYDSLEGYTLVRIPEPNETEPTPGAGWSYVDGAFVEVVASSPTPENAPSVIIEATPEATPEVTPEVTPEATPEVVPNVTS